MAVNFQINWPARHARFTSILGAVLLVLICNSLVFAQESSRKAIGMYADAAAFQNNAAYQLAIEEWEKLLREFPNDPLAGKAWHYLGVCRIQLEEPQYDLAIEAFKKAIADPKLEVREESLINLSWCLFNQAREAGEGSAAQKQGLAEAKQRLTQFLSKYRDGGYVDQALFYLGEIEYALGNARRSISYYRQLLDSKALAKSNLRADARYALAVAYEELGDSSRALAEYSKFVGDYATHRLVPEVQLRLADLELASGNANKAELILSRLLSANAEEMGDYALLRLGYALDQQEKSQAAAAKYSDLLSKYPDSVHAKTAALSLGQIRYRSNEYDAAAGAFEKALKGQDNQSADATHWMALTLMKQGKPSQAVELLEKSLKWAAGTDKAVLLQMDYADALYAMPDSLERARVAYESIAQDHPNDSLAPRAAYNAAFAALQEGKHPLARKWSEEFLAKYPTDSLRLDVTYVAAEALLLDGEHKSAAKAFEKLRQADRNNPSYTLWNLRLGMAYYLAGDYAAAIKSLEGELSRFSDANQRAEAQFILGASYLYNEDMKSAISKLSDSHRTSERWSSADEVLLLLAEAHQRNNDNASAKATLEKLLKKFPRSRLKAQADYKLAQLSAASNDFDEAIRKYNAIVTDVDAEAFHRFANYGIVWCQMQQAKYGDALARLQPLIRTGIRDSISVEAQLAEGICLRKLRRLDEAERSLEKYLGGSPRGTALANGLYELGLTLTESGKADGANRAFERILNEVPNYPAADKVLYELAWNLEEGSSDGLASKYFQRLTREFPNSEFAGEATYMLGQDEYEKKDYQRAAVTYTSVLRKTNDPELKEKSQYKLGWSLYQQGQYGDAAKEFAQQASRFPQGSLSVDAQFMSAECAFKREQFPQALTGYQQARANLERGSSQIAASEQVRALIYLHGAQCHRELKQWSDCESWLGVVMERYPESPYISTAIYELGYCKQKQGQSQAALTHYAEVANNYRNEVAARARFMMGEVYFAERDYAKAIPEFQRVMYGFGGDKAPEEIKNWQVKSAFEAARCSEVLVERLRGDDRAKILATAQEFYRFIVEKHAAHEMASKAQSRLGELQQLR